MISAVNMNRIFFKGAEVTPAQPVEQPKTEAPAEKPADMSGAQAMANYNAPLVQQAKAEEPKAEEVKPEAKTEEKPKEEVK